MGDIFLSRYILLEYNMSDCTTHFFRLIHTNLLFFGLAVTLSLQFNIMISEVYAGDMIDSCSFPADRLIYPIGIQNGKSIILKKLGGELNGQRKQKRENH